jgi:mono/diheme cytochrome c family protein
VSRPAAARACAAHLAPAWLLAACAASSAAEPASPAYPAGLAAFQANCAVCHGPGGAGVPSLAPPLLSYPARYAAGAEGRRQLAMTVLYGMVGEIAVEGHHYDFSMPSFSQLDDATLAAALNFVVFDLGHAPATVRPIAQGELAGERNHPLDPAAVHAHRKRVAPVEP